jgi:hypothetical protein
MKNILFILAGITLFAAFTDMAQAQQVPSAFAEPVIRKVTNAERAAFQRRFGNMVMTGEGFQGNTVVDNLPTTEIRARLQKAFGDPTVRLDDFIGRSDVRPGNSIQFEYWFIVNDQIPMMVLDIDGPFTVGLVYAGSVNFVDMMPEIKRTFSRMLMNVSSMGEFQDVFYSPERNEWFNVEYQNGTYKTDKITRPARFNSLRLN